MSVHTPKDRKEWQYDFWLEGHRFRGSTGVPKEKPKSVARRAEDVIRAEKKAELRRGVDPTAQRQRMTLDIAGQLYWDQVGQHEANSATVDGQIANLVRLLGAGTYLDQIGDHEVAHFVARRRGEPDRRYKREGWSERHAKERAQRGLSEPPLVSNATVNREVELLRRLLRRAIKVWKASTQDIDWSEHLLAEPAERIRALTEDEERRLIEAAAPYLHDPIRFSLWLGVRLQNAVQLDWTQIDLRARTITFQVKGRGRRRERKNHVIPITPSVLQLLLRQGTKERGRVFLRPEERRRPNGERVVELVPIQSWRTAWEGALRRAGIADFRWHDLRHTSGSRVVRKTGNLKVAQKLLGHSDIATTARYVHFLGDELADAIEGIAAQSPHEVPTIGRAANAK